MRMFNAFQTVLFFALAPFGLMWLWNASFYGGKVAFGLGAVAYLVYFAFMVSGINVFFEKDSKRGY